MAKMNEADRAKAIEDLKAKIAEGGIAALKAQAKGKDAGEPTVNAADVEIVAEALKRDAEGRGAVWATLAERFGTYTAAEFKAVRKAARKAVGDEIAKSANTVNAYLSRIYRLREEGLEVPTVHRDAMELYNALREATRPPKAEKAEEPEAIEPAPAPAPLVADPLAPFWDAVRNAANAAREAGVTVGAITAALEELTLAALVEADNAAEEPEAIEA